MTEESALESNHTENRQLAVRGPHPDSKFKARYVQLPLAYVQFPVAHLSNPQTHARRKPIYGAVPCGRAAIDNTTGTTAT